VATGLVAPDGTLGFTSGPVPTVTHNGAGSYELAISGFGTGCPLPQLLRYGNNAAGITFEGGPCGGGTIDTTVTLSGAADAYWTYMMVGVPATTTSAARPTAAPQTLP
jgi:hypothetical protein